MARGGVGACISGKKIAIMPSKFADSATSNNTRFTLNFYINVDEVVPLETKLSSALATSIVNAPSEIINASGLFNPAGKGYCFAAINDGDGGYYMDAYSCTNAIVSGATYGNLQYFIDKLD